MERQDSPLAALTTPLLAVLLATVFAGAFYRAKYRTLRPPAEPIPNVPFQAEKGLAALLSDDPFLPVYAAYAEAQAIDKEKDAVAFERAMGRFSVECLREQLKQVVESACGRGEGACPVRGHPDEESVLFLFLSTSGEAWPEDGELRARSRQAMVRALLHDQAYAPCDYRSVRAFEHPLNGSTLLVPYERFRPTPRNRQGSDSEASKVTVQEGPIAHWAQIVVLWLDDEALGEHPFRIVSEVRAAIANGLEIRSESCWVGPHNSGALGKLLTEGGAVEPIEPADGLELTSADLQRFPGRTRILSPYSTILMKAFRQGQVDALAADRWLLERTIGFDDKIAKLLIQELALRIPHLMTLDGYESKPEDPLGETVRLEAAGLAYRVLVPPLRGLGLVPERSSTVRIAVVSEQDSAYGRFWLENLRRERDLLKSENPLFGKIEFEPIHYLGGIDGLPLSRTRVSPEDERLADRFATYPFGASQVDYLRRMQDQLDNGREYDAVLVLGSSVYDSLMVIEALHSQLRDIPFLTVDMDARFFDRKHQGFMRNVVVASHLPLGQTLYDEPSPQFRDHYQFSLYRTLVNLLRVGVEARHDLLQDSKPRVYEIGLGTAVELDTWERSLAKIQIRRQGLESIQVQAGMTLDRCFSWAKRVLANALPAREAHAAESPEVEVLQSQEEREVGPELDKVQVLSNILLVLAAAYLFALVAFVTLPARAKDPHEALAVEGRRTRVMTAFAIAVASAFMSLLSWQVIVQARSAPIEPLAGFRGVSSWPAIGLQVACVVFCIGSILIIPRRLAREHARIKDEFLFFVPTGGRATRRKVGMGWLMGWSPRSRTWRRRGVEQESLVRCHSANDVWDWVGGLISNRWARGLRLLVYVLLFHAAAAAFYVRDPVNPPVRGELAYLIDRVSTVAVAWSFLALVFCVLEIYCFCTRLTLRLVEKRSTKLPTWVRSAQRRATGLKGPQADERVRALLFANVTQAIQGLVWYPMIALCLIIAARSSVIDGYSWPPILLSSLGLFFVLLVMCEFNMRRLAVARKRQSLEHFRDNALQHAGDSAMLARCKLVLEELDNLNSGAFTPLLQHAVVRAAFLPLIAYAGTQFMDPSRISHMLLGN